MEKQFNHSITPPTSHAQNNFHCRYHTKHQFINTSEAKLVLTKGKGDKWQAFLFFKYNQPNTKVQLLSQ